MPRLRLIGYWMADLREKLCLPQEFTGEMPKGAREQVAKYLRGGACYEYYRGFSWCRFFCGCAPSVMGGAELTDGEWAWPIGLAHYVEAHNVTLPDEFIQRVLQLGSPPQPPSPEHYSELKPEISLDYWIAWCAKHRSEHWRELISRARAEGDKVAAAHIRQWCASKISKYGLAEYSCGTLGCKERAMFGRKSCCEHSIVDFEYEELTNGCYPVTSSLVA